MAAALEDFRAQYPQYNHVSDEDLAAALYDKYYKGRVEPAEYRRQVGLPKIEAPPEPTISERIDNKIQRAAGQSDPLETTRDRVAGNKYTDPHGFEIDVDRPLLFNPDGTVSTESTIGVNIDGREYNIPTIVNGQRVSPDDAVEDARRKISEGWVFPNFATVEEAEQAAQARSGSVKQIRAGARADRQKAWNEDVDAFIEMADYLEGGPLAAWAEEERKASERGFLNNSMRRAGERTATLLGNAVQGIGRMGDYYNDYYGAGQIVFGSDWGEGDPADGKFRVRYMNAEEFDEFHATHDSKNILTDSVPEFYMSADFGAQERHTTQRVKDAYNNGEILGTVGSALAFGFEQGLTSIPDMMAVMGGPASISMYVNARANEMGTTRAENKGLAGDDAGFLENLEALPFAVGSALFERFGAGKIVQAFGKKSAEEVGEELIKAGYKEVAKRVATRTITAAGAEAGTEAFQEGVLEYLAEHLGTEAPLSWEDAVERGFFGALGGFSFGGAAGGTLALGGEAVRGIDQRMLQEMESELEFREDAPEIDVPLPPEDADTDFDEDGNVVVVGPDQAGADAAADAETGPPAEPDQAPAAEPPGPEPTPDPSDVPRETSPDEAPDREAEAAQEQYFDVRLKREEYRTRLANLADELVPGGGITTPSVNGRWFQDMNLQPETRMSVRQVWNAVNKANTGQRLGVRQQRVVEYMLDEVQGQREAGSNVDYARDQLQEARRKRAKARANAAASLDEALAALDTYEAENAGELLDEGEYLPEMTAEARIVMELADKLDDFGEDVGERVAIILDGAENTEQAMQVLEELSHEQQAAAAGAEVAPVEQASAPAPETEAAPDYELTAELDETTPPPTPPERRVNVELRNQIQELVDQGRMDEVVALIETDQLTGVGNRLAFDNMLPHAKAVGSIDVDSLGGINDNLGHGLGDQLIKAVANALEKAGLDVYRTGGDEFHVLGDNPGEIAAGINKAKMDLAHQVIENDKGRVPSIQITSGLAGNVTDADSIMEAAKKKKAAAGRRSPKGVLPPGSVIFSQVLNAEAGSNYVGQIAPGSTEMPIDPNGEYVLASTGETVNIPAKPVRRRHVIGYLERKFGVKIFQGRVKGSTRLGFYRPGHGEIRVKYHNDLETTAHEVSHWLDDRHPWISGLYKQYREEVLGVSYDIKKDYEGFAEFMRLFFTQEHQAREAAPGFFDAFMGAMESHPGIKDVVLDLQQMMHGWFLQGVRQRLASRVGTKPSITQRVRDVFQKWQDKLLMRIFDGLRPFKEIERQVRGTVSAAAWSGYKSLRLARGAHGVMQGILQRGTVNWNDDGDLVFTGAGIKQVFDPVSDRMENMMLYMVARRAQELRSQGRENLIPPDEIQAGLALGAEDPQLADVFQEWLDFNDRMFDFYQASGILSADSRRAIEEMNKNYVPFNRIIDTAMGERTKRGGSSPFMRLKGGSQDLADIFESIVGNTSHLVHMSLVNRGKANFYDMLDNTDNQTAGMYAAPIGKDTRPEHIHKEEVLRAVVEGLGLSMRWYDQLKKTGMYTSEAELELFNTVDTMASGLSPMVMFWKFGQDPRGDVDYYFRNGEKKFYEISDPLLYEAIGQIGPQQHNLAVAILGGFANVLRRGVTLTPTFQAKNFIRDTMNAFTLSKGGIVPALDATKALLERVYTDEHYWEYMINGGGFASMADADGINRDRVLDSKKKIWDHLDAGLSTFEYANRIAEFKQLKAKGWTAREAALAGREISTDFAMRGSSEALRVITISVPFLNARLQGLYRNGREILRVEDGDLHFNGKHALSYGLRSMLAITIPTLALYMLNKDDERYQEIPDWIRDLSWVIFTGPGEDDYVMIPKPFETGMLWGTLPERMLDYYYLRDEDELADAMLWMMLETFNLNPLPQAFKLYQELQKNKNWTGAPIIPQYLENVEPSEQYRAYTSDAMIALGRKLNISPMKAEHLVRGHLGTLGTWGLGLADYMVGDMANGGQAPTKGWKDNILVSPFVNDGPLRRTNSENELYDMLQETQRAANTVRQMGNRSPERIESYLSETKKEVLFGLNSDLAGWSRDMREIKNAMDIITADPELTGDQKRDALHELQRAKNEIARQVYLNINPEFVQQAVRDADNAIIRSRLAGEQPGGQPDAR